MHNIFLAQAIELSSESVDRGGFPVGVILVGDGTILATGISNGKQLHDPTSHAEMDAIRKATKLLGTRKLSDATLYSSMEPCVMCWSASTWASIPRIVYAASRSKLHPMHFEGYHNLRALNEKARKPIGLIHLEQLEPRALAIIAAWEQRLSR